MKRSRHWARDDIPDLTGKVAIVTGANTGIGYEAAQELTIMGADVTLACRSRDKGEAAAARIAAGQPRGSVVFAAVDLADLESVESFARKFADTHDRLDLLVNNAGVMVPPESTTRQGFELQFGVNHLAHFALTGLLLELLRTTGGARVVTLSSTAHRFGKIDFDDLDFRKRGYNRSAAYAQSKLANLLFCFELQRHIATEGLDVASVAAHPGWTATDLQRNALLLRILNVIMAMQPAQGALPTLRAATAQDVRGGDFYGPHGTGEMRGYPVRVNASAAARNVEDAVRLWEASEALTGVRYGHAAVARPAAG